jgi:hypothetical protein
LKDTKATSIILVFLSGQEIAARDLVKRVSHMVLDQASRTSLAA